MHEDLSNTMITQIKGMLILPGNRYNMLVNILLYPMRKGVFALFRSYGDTSDSALFYCQMHDQNQVLLEFKTEQ